VGLASTIAFYNIHLLLHNPQEKTLTITVGGLQYTGNIELVKHHYLLEENHWKNHLPSPLNKPETFLFIELRKNHCLKKTKNHSLEKEKAQRLQRKKKKHRLKNP
jgi:hypothetical protein